MHSESLIELRRDFLTRVGVPTLKAAAVAVVLGAVTFVLGHQGAGFTVVTGIAVAAVVAAASLILMLVRMVTQLERDGRRQRRDIEALNQKIGAHRAIASWVENCENAMADKGRGPDTEARAKQELDLLVANVINSVKNYSFYSPQLQDDVRDLARGEPDQLAAERLDRLLAHLKRQLQAGAYLV